MLIIKVSCSTQKQLDAHFNV